jgi:hypothetical protein
MPLKLCQPAQGDSTMYDPDQYEDHKPKDFMEITLGEILGIVGIILTLCTVLYLVL